MIGIVIGKAETLSLRSFVYLNISLLMSKATDTGVREEEEYLRHTSYTINVMICGLQTILTFLGNIER